MEKNALETVSKISSKVGSKYISIFKSHYAVINARRDGTACFYKFTKLCVL